MSSTGFEYAMSLCGSYPTADGLFFWLRLPCPVALDGYAASNSGPYRLACRGRRVRALAGHGLVPYWQPGLVLASLVHPEPPAELLAVATLLLAEGSVEVLEDLA